MLLKTRAILVVVVGTVMGLSLSLSGGLLANRPPPEGDELALEHARLLAEVMQRIKRDYVEPVDDSALFDRAIRGMVSDLDPHSQFLDADEYRDIRISTTGSYTGIALSERLRRCALNAMRRCPPFKKGWASLIWIRTGSMWGIPAMGLGSVIPKIPSIGFLGSLVAFQERRIPCQKGSQAMKRSPRRPMIHSKRAMWIVIMWKP